MNLINKAIPTSSFINSIVNALRSDSTITSFNLSSINQYFPNQVSNKVNLNNQTNRNDNGGLKFKKHVSKDQDELTNNAVVCNSNPNNTSNSTNSTNSTNNAQNSTTAPVNNSTTYQIYSISKPLFSETLFSDQFQMNFSQNCSLTVVNGDPTYLYNIITCQGDIIINLGTVVMMTNVFNTSANCIDWTASQTLASSWQFGLTDTVPTQVKIMQLWVLYQISINFQATIVAKRVFNNFQMSSSI
jgi:hypothetical protein